MSVSSSAMAPPRARVTLAPKREVSASIVAHLIERMNQDEHRHDAGPINVWTSDGYADNLFVVMDQNSDQPIGIVYRAGLPTETDVAWWFDREFRGQGFGNAMIDALVRRLIAEGVTGLGRIRIDTFRGDYDRASRRLVQRLETQLAQQNDTAR